ncbi:hypothetical protein SLA2020_396160 [Shorea laevis]
MPSETIRSSSTLEGDKQRQFDREIKGMVTAITQRVSEIHKPGSSRHEEDGDSGGANVIMLAGTNHGATMRSEMDEKSGVPQGKLSVGEPDALNTYVNSNFQAVNNSIMLDSRYNTNDPGVRMEVSEGFEFDHQGPKEKKKGKKKKEKESFENDQGTGDKEKEGDDSD